MTKAVWNGVVIAEAPSAAIMSVEGNSYFPPDALKREHFSDSPTTTACPWKGLANYYSIVVDGQTNKDAAWVYRTPKDDAKQIKDHVAFWRGVTIEA